MKRFWLASAFSVAAGAASVLGYWAQQRELPVQSKVIEVVGPAHPGGKVLVRWAVYRDSSCATTKQELAIDVNGLRWVLKAIYYKQAMGPMGFDNFVSQTELPADIPTGEARLRVSLAYVCNPLHTIWPVINQVPDIPFTITPRPKVS